jgi:hypothetical protein
MSAPESSRGAVERGTEFGGGPPVELPSCDVLLGEFLALVGQIEADFTRRWDAARLSASMGPRRPAPQPGWPTNV